MMFNRKTGLYLLAFLCAGLTSTMSTHSAQAGCSDYPGPGVDWTSCRKRNVVMEGSDFSNAKLAKINFTASDLRQSKFINADLNKAVLPRANFSGSDLSGANLSKIEANRSKFRKANLEGSILLKAEMFRAEFSGSNLKHTDLNKAELGRVDFTDADLTGAMITFTNLARANFSGATLVGTNMEASWTYLTRFEGVDLSKVENLSQDQINLSCGDDKTALPEGLEAPSHWPCSADD